MYRINRSGQFPAVDAFGGWGQGLDEGEAQGETADEDRRAEGGKAEAGQDPEGQHGADDERDRMPPRPQKGHVLVQEAVR